MRGTLVLGAALVLLLGGSAVAQGHGGGGRVSYEGDHHTSSHGGSFSGSSGTSHRGGHYTSPTGSRAYGAHR